MLLSRKENSLERQYYTFLDLIGDFGGFFGAIVIFPPMFLSFYSSRMFGASLLEDLPVRTPKSKKRSQINQLQKKLYTDAPIEKLD